MPYIYIYIYFCYIFIGVCTRITPLQGMDTRVHFIVNRKGLLCIESKQIYSIAFILQISLISGMQSMEAQGRILVTYRENFPPKNIFTDCLSEAQIRSPRSLYVQYKLHDTYKML